VVVVAAATAAHDSFEFNPGGGIITESQTRARLRASNDRWAPAYQHVLLTRREHVRLAASFESAMGMASCLKQ
jgi:hypothetical protein